MSTDFQRKKWRNDYAKRREYNCEQKKRYWIENKDKIKARRKLVYDPKKELERVRKYEQSNPDNVKARAKRKTDRLTDCYIRNNCLRWHDAPKEIIDAKRVLLKLHRAIKRHE